jgi:D-alanyl-D-alanine carboxypeptidase/D-alanyl-D-alanine-endopeptidase (penicillin-binding protein 4)
VTTAERPPARTRRRRGRGPGPWIVLAVVAVVPAIGLFAMHSWASARDDAGEPTPAAAMVDVSTTAAPELTTGVLTFRRVPTIVSRELNADAFAAEVSPFLGSLNDRSCGAVSVDAQPIAQRNADIAVIPASNQKLPVAAAALERLGPDFTYTTEVVARSEPVDGVVEGDLVIVGGGDPLLSSDWYPSSNLELNPVTSPTSFDDLADRVAAAGVTAVTGSVVGDGSRYDDEYFAPGWGDGVAGLEGGPYDALMANDSRVLGDPQRGNDPNEAAAREFTLLLEARGIDVGGDASTGSAPPDAVTIASVESAPMSAVIAEMLGNSDNNTAEMVVKELGFTLAGNGTREAGLGEVRELLAEWGIDMTPVVLVDGSGLSLDNRLTCDALLTVLQRTGFESPVGQGLPIAGQTGTLATAFEDHPVAGRLRGKTGTLNNPPFNVDPPAVKALAGYLPVEGGSVIEYVLVLNGPTISDQSEYRPLWDQLADALDTYPAHVSPSDVGPR